MAAPLRVLLLVVLPFAGALVVACDDLNRPAYVPKSEVRKQCFSDVECPGSKCIKTSADEIQGHCADTASSADGGAPPGEGGAAPPSSTGPAPGVQPQPGDIQI
jgi:hypothetical protein